MMHTILIQKLRSYLVENNPDVLVSLQQGFTVTRYLEDKVALVGPFLEKLVREEKPQYIIEELCMREMTEDLRPSKFLYIRNILEEEFLQTYERYLEMGVLTYEIMNMIEKCKPVFEHLGFAEENEDNRQLHYAITGTIAEYLEKN